MKLLFVNHSASRTGAPIVLLHFLKWMKATKNVHFDILTLQTGELLDDFTEISDNHYYKHEKNDISDKIIRVVRNKFGKEKLQDIKYPLRELDNIAKNNYDVIYANTISSVSVAAYLKKRTDKKSKLLMHFHEMNLTIHRQCPNFDAYTDSIDFSIAASYKVKDNLILNWGFTDEYTEVVYEYSKIPNNLNKTSQNFVVGASGQVDWRKGTDFFIMVADYVTRKLPNKTIKFQWVGKVSRMNRLIFEEDIRKLKLQDVVEFTGVKESPHNYFSNFDVFLMTSKEDPFPLVCIEIGMMGIPIVCFEGATGTEEVLQDIESSVVPYLDIASMGDAVIRYFKDEQFKILNGHKTKQVFQDFTPEKQGEKLYTIINDLIANSTK